MPDALRYGPDKSNIRAAAAPLVTGRANKMTLKRLALMACIACLSMPIAVSDTGAASNSAERQLPSSLPAFLPTMPTTAKFDVFRQGQPFGRHIIHFEPSEEGRLTVENDVYFRAGLGPITIYKYKHNSTETWQNGALTELVGHTEKSGKDFEVMASARNGRLIVDGTLNMSEVDGRLLPFSHWNVGQVDDVEILSSESGELIPIHVEPVARDVLMIDGEAVEATRYRMTSELTADLWYDDTGRWVGFAFTARNQKIEYRLQELY